MSNILAAGAFAVYTISAGAACLVGISILGALGTAVMVIAAP